MSRKLEIKNSDAEVFRSLIKHENELRNHRMSWFFGVQGFLISACGYALTIENYGNLMLCLSLLGFLLTIMLGREFIFSQFALISLQNEWNCLKARYTEEYDGPPIIGLELDPRSVKTDWYIRAEFGVPILFCIVWFVVFLFSAFEAVQDTVVSLLFVFSIIFCFALFLPRHIRFLHDLVKQHYLNIPVENEPNNKHQSTTN